MSRQIKATNPDYDVAHFGLATRTGILRCHLYENHLDLWVTACDKLKIMITVKDTQPAIAAFHQEPSKTCLETARTEYSKEAFLNTNALAEFIVADDQVQSKVYLQY